MCLVHMITVSILVYIPQKNTVSMRPMRWVGDVDQSEFEHACQSALSLNYPYDNDCVGNTNMIRVININDIIFMG